MPEETSHAPATPASSAEGLPTSSPEPQVTATAPETTQTVDNATSQTPITESPSSVPAAAVETKVTGLDVGEVKTPDDYKRYMEDLQSGKIKLPEQPAPEAVPAPPETSPVEPEDDDVPATGGRKPSMKVPLPDDPDMANLQSETMRIVRDRNRAKKPISFSEAEGLAKRVLGIPDTPSTASPQVTPESTATPETPSGQPQTLEEVSAAIADLVQEKAAKNKQFDFDEDVEIEARLEVLRDQKAVLLADQRAAQAGAKNLEQSWAASQTKVQQQYPDSKVADSVLNMVASKLEESWRAAGDQRLNSPNAPELLYAEAFKKIGQPAPSQVPTSPTPPSKPVSRLPAAAAVLASGSAGSIAPIASPQDPDMSGITDPLSYMQTLASASGGRYAATKVLG